MKKAIFTICAKNYLAQALTLRQTVLRHNPNVDFFLFLSDLPDVPSLPDFVLPLDETCIPQWRQMAFKYDVIEFSTSIKPFYFARLFGEGYERVLYIDPDIYVTASLGPIFEMLNEKSMVLTPHYCTIQTHYTGLLADEEQLFAGIFNLGFAGIKNDEVGHKIVEWWCNRLENKCYGDKQDGLFVDQKWIDFVPAFFPDDIFISHHMGMNAASWNLHERQIERDANGNYGARNRATGQLFPLLFYHFSNFKPTQPQTLHRHFPHYNAALEAGLKPLVEEYVAAVFGNEYQRFSAMVYSFNTFEDGENIMPLHRRLYRAQETTLADANPFALGSKIHTLLQRSRLLSGVKSSAFTPFTAQDQASKGRYLNIIQQLLWLTQRVVGVKYYSALLSAMRRLSRLENQTFLLKK